MQKEENYQSPLHIAIIPDGNRRWAKAQGKKPWEGHEEGAKRIEEIVRKALKLGVKYLTFWGSSVDNLTKRPLEEKRALLRIYENYFTRFINSREVFENQAAINVFGRWEEQFPKKLKKILKEGVARTKDHTKHFLSFLLAYNGDDEMLLAIKRIAEIAKETKDKLVINSELIQRNLMAGMLPEVDLLIRTGSQNDPHNSAGFMMWHTKNSQYYFSSKMMPDFGEKEFEEAIKEYQRRTRRFGK